MHFDLWHLREAHHRVIVEVTLLYLTVDDIDIAEGDTA